MLTYIKIAILLLTSFSLHISASLHSLSLANKKWFMLSSGTSIANPVACMSSLQVADFCHTVLKK